MNPLFALLLLLLAPFAAALIQLAISRTREFDADAAGADLAGSGLGLASALAKLDAHARELPLEGEIPAHDHLFIVQPLSGAGHSLASLFRTHPDTEERIRRLRARAPRVEPARV